jgi:14-3-3 protein epsilon
MAKYEKNVYIAMLAEQCSRFEEMIEYLEDMLKKRDNGLSSDERNLLSIAYKNSISSRRTALRTIIAYEMKEKKKDNSTFLPYIQEYRKKVEEELANCCRNVLASIDNNLLKRTEDDEAKVFYLKMKGDYNRYIAECTQGDLKDKTANDALNSYKEASNCAKNLNTIHPISLGLALNFSVFYYEVMSDQETACKIAKETLDNVNKELPNIDEDDETQRDALSIINLLRENLEMWKFDADQ